MTDTLVQEFDPAIPLRKLKEHPDNPRRGNDDIVAESVDSNGFYGGVLVQRSTGFVIGGNTWLRVMRKRKAKTIPGFWIDCDDATARRILLMDNRSSDLATYDDSMLAVMLSQVVEEEASLIGTGYDDAFLAELMLTLDEPGLDAGSFRDSLDPVEDDRGDALALLDVTLAEPDHQVSTRDVYRLHDPASGRTHTLIVCDVMRDHEFWIPLLTAAGPDAVFLPYPGVYVAFVTKASEHDFVMVQPNHYLAGHVLDKWQSVKGAGSITLEDQA